MKTLRHYWIIVCFLFVFSCKSNDNYESFFGKQLVLPPDVVFTSNVTDTVYINLSGLKIVYYISQKQCFSCSLKEFTMGHFYSLLDSLFGKNVPILIYINAKSNTEVKLLIERDHIVFPLGIDLSNHFYNENSFPDNFQYNCFLLDSNNRVVLIGNPVKNSKIRELYIKTICERLGVDYQKNTEVPENLDLGTFSQSQTKTAEFIIPNNTQSVMEIDSVYTSCECTTAEFDNKVIHPKENAIISVTYKPDGVGDFYREVYVKVKDENKPLVYSIKGTVIK